MRSDENAGRRQEQTQLQEQRVSDADIEFQEQLIQEREGEIEQIEQGIVELNQIFKDIGTLVEEQQTFVGARLTFPSLMTGL
jgi:syntaxin 7